MENHTSIAQNNEFPLHIIHNLKKKLIAKKQRQKRPTTTTQQVKKWVTFSYHSKKKKKILISLNTLNLNIALRATNTIHRKLTDKLLIPTQIPAGYTNSNVAFATIHM
jgi:hypothetical protein